MAEMTLKMNAFEPLAMDEVMAVDGGLCYGSLYWRGACRAIALGAYVDYKVVKHLYTLGYENGYNSTRK